jgi:hypothetical protein
MENKFILGDCMDKETGLPSYPDNYLAIVDPPYGITVNAERNRKPEKSGQRLKIMEIKNGILAHQIPTILSELLEFQKTKSFGAQIIL